MIRLTWITSRSFCGVLSKVVLVELSPHVCPQSRYDVTTSLIFTRSGTTLSGSQLKITYKDLLEAKSKGKWWVVGSAWQGSIDTPSNSDSVTELPKAKTGSQTRFTSKLLELARKQRMNTATRRDIFCTIMSAEVSVCDRLSALLLRLTVIDVIDQMKKFESL